MDATLTPRAASLLPTAAKRPGKLHPRELAYLVERNLVDADRVLTSAGTAALKRIAATPGAVNAFAASQALAIINNEPEAVDAFAGLEF